MKEWERKIAAYDYALPNRLIARKPASPRDQARLFVYDRKSGRINFDIFLNLADYLPDRAVLVFNETRVMPARFLLKKESGGSVRALYLGRKEKGLLEFMADRKIPLGSRLFLDNQPFLLVTEKRGSIYLMKPLFPVGRLDDLMERRGMTPIPPYIKDSPLSEKELRKKYQSVFARQSGSVAAPTASLHFTKRLFRKLEKAGHKLYFIDLRVGPGTFAPVREENLVSRKLHPEFYRISSRTARELNRAKQEKRPIIAVGTTAARALESASDREGKLNRLSAETELFIEEDYRFKFVDGLITNFHLPKSSLLMLVSALIPRKKLLSLYRRAIGEKFRFFSFGDGMLIK
jgi:S-adenosylmethionine:tRNA ribosyltransferase-isomerase